MAAVSERCRASVTFAGDDDVIQHIVPIADRKSSKKCIYLLGGGVFVSVFNCNWAHAPVKQ